MDATQFAALLGVIGGGASLIAAAIRFGLGRVAKSFDAMGAKFDAMATKHEGEERALIKLESTVSEGRQDIADVKDTVLDRLGPRGGRRPATAPT